MINDAFYDRRDLQIFTSVILKKVVKVERIVGIKIVHYCHGVPFNIMFVQELYATHHLHPRGNSSGRASILVMKLLWPINRHTYKPIVLVQKLAPLVGKQCAIGLYGVVDASATSIFLLQLDSLTKER